MLARSMRLVARFLREEDGPTAVEYAVVLALIVAVVASVSNIGGATNSMYTNPALQNATKPPGP